MMDEHPNVKVVKRLYDAFERGDIPAVLAQLSENVVWTMPGTDASPVSGVFRGRDGVNGFFSKVIEHFDIDGFAPGQTFADGDTVVVLGTERAAPKGRPPAPIDWVHVFTVRDGLITDFREYFDTAEFERR
jgi:ketosteroid isomerase-like protein